MREVASETQSVALRRTQAPSRAISGTQRYSEASAAISSPHLIREQRAAIACVLQRVGDVGERMDLMRVAIGTQLGPQSEVGERLDFIRYKRELDGSSVAISDHQ